MGHSNDQRIVEDGKWKYIMGHSNSNAAIGWYKCAIARLSSRKKEGHQSRAMKLIYGDTYSKLIILSEINWVADSENWPNWSERGRCPAPAGPTFWLLKP